MEAKDEDIDRLVKTTKMWHSAFDALESAFLTEDITHNVDSVLKVLSKYLNTDDIQIFKYDRINMKFDFFQVLNSDKAPLYLETKDYLKNRKRKKYTKPENMSFIEARTKYSDYIIAIKDPKLDELTSQKYLETIQRIFQLMFFKLESEEEKIKIYLTDPLTGIGNRVAYDDSTKKFFKGKSKEATYTIMDLYRLKAINDNYWHSVGDQYIKKAAEIVCGELNKRERKTFFRIGGDEFSLFLPGLKKDYIQDKLWKANLKLNKETLGCNIDFPLTLSYGVVEGRDNLDSFYRKADDELSYYKKELYRKLNTERRK